jgi:hypothetical protein
MMSGLGGLVDGLGKSCHRRVVLQMPRCEAKHVAQRCKEKARESARSAQTPQHHGLPTRSAASGHSRSTETQVRTLIGDFLQKAPPFSSKISNKMMAATYRHKKKPLQILSLLGFSELTMDRRQNKFV